MGSHKKPLFHPLVVVDSAGGKIFVRDDQDLAVLDSDLGGFHPDLFNRSAFIIKDDVIADSEGMVEEDDEVAEEVAQRSLCRYGDGDAADSKPGDRGGDVHPQSRKKNQDAGGPDEQLDKGQKNLEVVRLSCPLRILFHQIDEGRSHDAVDRPDCDVGSDHQEADVDDLSHRRAELRKGEREREGNKEQHRKQNLVNQFQDGEVSGFGFPSIEYFDSVLENRPGDQQDDRGKKQDAERRYVRLH